MIDIVNCPPTITLPKDNFERLVRLQAEFENFKKRHYREKQDFKKYCVESIMLELLPNLDNLERGLDSAKKSAELDAIIEGIEMIHRGLTNCLQKFGLKPIETIEKIFNPVNSSCGIGGISSKTYNPPRITASVKDPGEKVGPCGPGTNFPIAVLNLNDWLPVSK